MIPANKGGPLGWSWDRYVDHKVRRSFRGVWARGALPDSDEPLLVYANHGSFWDGFLAHQLCRATGRDGYCVMEEQNLARYGFLARIGAFSIRRGDAASALETLRYARGLLKKPDAAVFIFPEGALHPFGARPLELERGLELLARWTNALCVPVAFRCVMLEHELPDALIEVGPAHRGGELREFRERLDDVVTRVGAATSTEGFRQLVRGARGVAERWDLLHPGDART